MNNFHLSNSLPVYICVRVEGGNEPYLDLATVAVTASNALSLAVDYDVDHESFAKENPVIGVGLFHINSPDKKGFDVENSLTFTSFLN